jgi:hypothetical protein
MKKNLMRWLSRFAMGLALFGFIVIVNFVLFFSYEQGADWNGNYGTLIIVGNIIFLANTANFPGNFQLGLPNLSQYFLFHRITPSQSEAVPAPPEPS